MAVLTPKRLNFVTRLLDMNLQLLRTNDALASLKSEWDANAYATGASPAGNNITDQDLSGTAFDYMTTAQLNALIGAHAAIAATVAANRGYLEAARA